MTVTPIFDISTVPVPSNNESIFNSFDTFISDKYREKIINFIEEIEAETGHHHFISIRSEGKNLTEIYPLEERTRSYEVIMKDTNFSLLDGKYSSLNSIKDKIKSLYLESQSDINPPILLHGDYVWKCDQCNSYGSERTLRSGSKSFRLNRYPSNNYSYTHCENCSYQLRTNYNKWLGLELFPESGIIGTSSGGSISVINELGILKISK